MTSPSSSQNLATPLPAPSGAVVLRIRGLGPLFNFKNSKVLTRRGVMTDPGLKKRMDAITQSFASQLRSHFRIGVGATLTDAQLQSLTLSLPHDDCWTAVPELVVSARLVGKGDDGAVVTIERLA